MTASRQTKSTVRWSERWCPPKPLASVRVVEKVLNRHVLTEGPETRLVVAVIALAIVDCLEMGNRSIRREAREFVLGPELEWWCELVGLDATFVRHVAARAGYLVSEASCWQKVPVKVPAKRQTSEPQEVCDA